MNRSTIGGPSVRPEVKNDGSRSSVVASLRLPVLLVTVESAAAAISTGSNSGSTRPTTSTITAIGSLRHRGVSPESAVIVRR
ncbi:hypothetical protein BS297_17050 [Rhodococcus erythropolis]|uniref:Uncharacterized protein n=1 Tax=Rhodococcus erythropolis TaxID=1833 RepID=A0A0C3A2Y9_RHOER|nr:hypothetical protein BS297_17050 [Rhodococcus erythropolis]KIM14589.1 hypothetical protein QV65_30940 [Rhodococcus erythropolis]